MKRPGSLGHNFGNSRMDKMVGINDCLTEHCFERLDYPGND